MLLETSVMPRGPYWLARSTRTAGDPTRRFRDGVLTVVFEVGGQPARARVWQRRDGSLDIRVESPAPAEAFDQLRFMLAVADDHTAFLRRFARDPLLGEATRRLQGLRPLRAATVSHSLLKALCGQLVQVRAARLLEARLLRCACGTHEGLPLPPARATFSRFSPAELVRHGLVSRKATALVRLSRELDLERLRALPTEAVATRLLHERGIGPWSVGMVVLYGLGRYDHGLVGDLGLIELCRSLLGRRADADDTRELLERYGEWAGLASVYLLASARPQRGSYVLASAA